MWWHWKKNYQSWPFSTYSLKVPRVIVAPDHTQWHTHTHTQSLGRTPLDEGSARRRNLLPDNTTLTRDNTSVPWVGFEPAIPVSLRPSSHWNRRPEILQAVIMETIQVQKERSRFSYLETGPLNIRRLNPECSRMIWITIMAIVCSPQNCVVWEQPLLCYWPVS